MTNSDIVSALQSASAALKAQAAAALAGAASLDATIAALAPPPSPPPAPPPAPPASPPPAPAPGVVYPMVPWVVATPPADVTTPTPPADPTGQAVWGTAFVNVMPANGAAGPQYRTTVPFVPGPNDFTPLAFPFRPIPDAPWPADFNRLVCDPLTHPLHGTSGWPFLQNGTAKWMGAGTYCDRTKTADSMWGAIPAFPIVPGSQPRGRSRISPYSTWIAGNVPGKASGNLMSWAGIDLWGNHYCVQDDGIVVTDPSPNALRCSTDLAFVPGGSGTQFYISYMLGDGKAGNGVVALVDFAAKTTRIIAQGLAYPQSLVLHPDGFLYVACTGMIGAAPAVNATAGSVVKIDPNTGQVTTVTAELNFPAWVRIFSGGDLCVATNPPGGAANVRALFRVTRDGIVTPIMGTPKSSPGTANNALIGAGSWLAFDVDVWGVFGGSVGDVIVASSVPGMPNADWSGFPQGLDNNFLLRVNATTGAVSCFCGTGPTEETVHYPWAITLGADSLGRPRVFGTGFASPTPFLLRPRTSADAVYPTKIPLVSNQGMMAQIVQLGLTGDPSYHYAAGAYDLWLSKANPCLVIGPKGFNQMGYKGPDEIHGMSYPDARAYLSSVVPGYDPSDDAIYFIKRQSVQARFAASAVPLPAPAAQ